MSSRKKTVYNGYKLTRVKVAKKPSEAWAFKGLLTKNGFKVCAFESTNGRDLVIDPLDPGALRDCIELVEARVRDGDKDSVRIREYASDRGGGANQRHRYVVALILALMAEDGYLERKASS